MRVADSSGVNGGFQNVGATHVEGVAAKRKAQYRTGRRTPAGLVVQAFVAAVGSGLAFCN